MKYYLTLITLILIIIISFKLSKPSKTKRVYMSDEVLIENILPLINGKYDEITLDSNQNEFYNQLLIKYNIDKINYNDFLSEIEYILEHNAILLSSRFNNMIRTLNIDIDSQIKIYMQNNKENTLTTIFLVNCDNPLNEVRVVNLGDFITEVLVNKENDLEVYLKQSNKKIIIDIS